MTLLKQTRHNQSSDTCIVWVMELQFYFYSSRFKMMNARSKISQNAFHLIFLSLVH